MTTVATPTTENTEDCAARAVSSIAVPANAATTTSSCWEISLPKRGMPTSVSNTAPASAPAVFSALIIATERPAS